MPSRILLKGPRGSGRCIVFWAPTKEALSRGFTGCQTISRKNIEAIVRIGRHYTDKGAFPKNKHKFKQLEDESLFEIKGYQARLIGFFDGPKFVIVHCTTKQQDKHSKSDLEKANRLKESYHEGI